MPTVKLRDINVNYEEFGEGRPLLVIHGWRGNGRMFASVFEPYFEQRTGWRRLYPDLLDFGDAAPPDWLQDADGFVDILVAFLDALAPGQRFVVAGISWGGYLTRGIVRRRLQQIDGVMFEVPLMAYDLTESDLPPRQVVSQNPEFIAALQSGEEWLQDVFVFQNRAALDSLRTTVLANWADSNEAIMERDKPYLFDADALPEPCSAPALFLTGRQDHLAGYKQAWSILENFPRATFAVLDRAGHFVRNEQATLYRALVHEWLDRVEEYIATSRPVS
jgi:pimeloyl-ACP methyl ester carboxylesterase